MFGSVLIETSVEHTEHRKYNVDPDRIVFLVSYLSPQIEPVSLVYMFVRGSGRVS